MGAPHEFQSRPTAPALQAKQYEMHAFASFFALLPFRYTGKRFLQEPCLTIRLPTLQRTTAWIPGKRSQPIWAAKSAPSRVGKRARRSRSTATSTDAKARSTPSSRSWTPGANQGNPHRSRLPNLRPRQHLPEKSVASVNRRPPTNPNLYVGRPFEGRSRGFRPASSPLEALEKLI